MTLTVNIPSDLDAVQRERLALALYDARALSAEQAAALAGQPASEFLSSRSRINVQESAFANRERSVGELRQGSPAWKALLRCPGPAHGVALSLEATSREMIYEDNLR